LKFLLDNDVPDRIAGVLREAGHEVVRVRDALELGKAGPQGLGGNINFA